MKSEGRAGQGWQEVAVSGGPHLKRIPQMYQERGLEVHLEEFMPEEQQRFKRY